MRGRDPVIRAVSRIYSYIINEGIPTTESISYSKWVEIDTQLENMIDAMTVGDYIINTLRIAFYRLGVLVPDKAEEIYIAIDLLDNYQTFLGPIFSDYEEFVRVSYKQK